MLERPGLGFALGLGWIICKPSSSNERETGFTGYGVLYQLRAGRAITSGEAGVPSTSMPQSQRHGSHLDVCRPLIYFGIIAVQPDGAAAKREGKKRPKHSGKEDWTKSRCCCCCGSRSGSKMRAEQRAEHDEASFAALLLALPVF